MYWWQIYSFIFEGCKDLEMGLVLKQIFQTPYFRIVVVQDEQTVELCGALKVFDSFCLIFFSIPDIQFILIDTDRASILPLSFFNLIQWTVADWLVFYGTSTHDRLVCAIVPKVNWILRLRIANDEQYRPKHLLQLKWTCNGNAACMPYLLKDKQCIQQITITRISKINAICPATPSLSLISPSLVIVITCLCDINSIL